MGDNFAQEVFGALRTVPSGCVITYGQLAALAGRPRAARAVGNILHKNTDPIGTPCYRVVHSDGSLAPAYAFGGIDIQRKMLEADGVIVVNYKVDLNEYGIAILQ